MPNPIVTPGYYAATAGVISAAAQGTSYDVPASVIFAGNAPGNLPQSGIISQPAPDAAAAAAAVVFAAPAPRSAPQRARLGARGLCAAGILAAGIAAQPPAAVLPPPRPVITHAAPHRAAWRSVTGQAYVAVPPPRQRPPQPRSPAPHRALWQRNTVAPRQPQGPSRLPLPLRRPGPHRAITGGVRGPQPSAAAPGVAVPPPGWHPQPRFTPPHRVTWRAAAGLPAPPQTVTTPPPRQLPQVPRRVPARALWRARAVPPRLSTLPLPHPAAIPRQAPHRVIWRLVTGQPPAAGIAVRAPGLIPQPRHLPPARGIWRRLAGPGNAPPPAFSVGALTASGAPSAVLTAAGASSALTAATAPSGTLTAATVPGNALELAPVQDEMLGELFDEAGGQVGA